MIRAEEYYKKSEGSHFDEIKDLAISKKLKGWEEFYWTGVYLYTYAPDGKYYKLIIEVLEESFFEGLTYLLEKECYLEAVRILGRIYLETQQFDLALNMLQMLIIKDANVPDWVYLRFVFAQMHSDTAQRLIDEPQYFFEKVERIDITNESSVSQRNAIFQEYLQICTQYYKRDGIFIDTNTLFEKALEYDVLHTEAWKDFASNFPNIFGVMPIDEIDEVLEADDEESDDIITVSNLSETCLAELEQENSELTQKMHSQQHEIAELMKKNQSYERLLEEQKALIQQLTANGIKIDNINRSLQCGNDAGHDLLEGRKKILVIGQAEISTDKLLGISKSYGYEKSDFVFWDDYSKIKSYAERMDSGALSFMGIIAGPMPHKVTDLGDYSSLIEKMKQPCYPHMEEARSESGELKLTKHSFKKALEKMTQHLLAIQ